MMETTVHDVAMMLLQGARHKEIMEKIESDDNLPLIAAQLDWCVDKLISLPIPDVYHASLYLSLMNCLSEESRRRTRARVGEIMIHPEFECYMTADAIVAITEMVKLLLKSQ